MLNMCEHLLKNENILNFFENECRLRPWKWLLLVQPLGQVSCLILLPFLLNCHISCLVLALFLLLCLIICSMLENLLWFLDNFYNLKIKHVLGWDLARPNHSITGPFKIGTFLSGFNGRHLSRFQIVVEIPFKLNSASWS